MEDKHESCYGGGDLCDDCTDTLIDIGLQTIGNQPKDSCAICSPVCRWNYNLNEEDIQSEAMEKLGRQLNPAEMQSVTHTLDNGCLNEEVMQIVSVAIGYALDEK